ncbi:MAG: zinc-dependent metalloprotease family protein, partial [Thermoguttaceae bacterium]
MKFPAIGLRRNKGFCRHDRPLHGFRLLRSEWLESRRLLTIGTLDATFGLLDPMSDDFGAVDEVAPALLSEETDVIGGDPPQSADRLWQAIDDMPTVKADAQPSIQASRFETFTLDAGLMRSTLAGAPLEFTIKAAGATPVISLPTPDGDFSRFTVIESSVMEPGLAAKFPEIRTYAGQGIDDPAASVRFDMTPAGFHAQVLTPSETYYVEPYWHLDTSLYASYYLSDSLADWNEDHEHTEEVSPDHHLEGVAAEPLAPTETEAKGHVTAIGDELRTYRLAVAATDEYSASKGGTVASTMAAIVTRINRANGILQREVAVRMVLVVNNDQLVLPIAGDPYTNGNRNTMLGENQTNVDSVIGSANYDIGHVFGTGGGGMASVGVVGNNSRKARGVTLGNALLTLVHEIGHQLGANHTFNGVNGSCGNPNQYNAATAYEPGSGSTIMSYGGACGTDNVQTFTSSYFHSISLDEIINYTHAIIGNAAATITATGNNIPIVGANRDRTIPAATPFVLTISGGGDTDLSDRLTYTWEQRDLGPDGAQPLTTADDGQSPLFRSWPPRSSGTRTFPSSSNLLAGTMPLGEQLPTTNRDLNFRVTVRDNNTLAGGVSYDEIKLTVIDTGAPFRVTSPNTSVTWDGGASRTITWDVADTNAAPINAGYVNILFSDDGGLSFPSVMAANTPNDGSQIVTIPNIETNQARIKVEPVGNIFFDISNTNFTIEAVPVEFVLYGISFGGSIYNLDQTSGLAVFSSLSASVDNPVGITLRPEDGNFYLLTDANASNIVGTEPNSLYKLNPYEDSSFRKTLVGPTGLTGGVMEGDLDFDPTTGILYGLYTGGPFGSPRRELFTMDLDTGEAQIVGTINHPADLSAMAFNRAGDLYVLDNGIGSLLKVDKTTGAILSQVTLSRGLGTLAGMDFHPETGILFVADGGSDSSNVRNLFTLNTSTGFLTLIGSTG